MNFFQTKLHPPLKMLFSLWGRRGGKGTNILSFSSPQSLHPLAKKTRSKNIGMDLIWYGFNLTEFSPNGKFYDPLISVQFNTVETSLL